MIKYEIYIGLNDKDELIQVVSDKKVMELLSKLSDNMTITKTTGVYMGIQEPSIKVEIIGEARDRIDLKEKLKSLKVLLNQECILMTETVLNDIKFI